MHHLIRHILRCFLVSACISLPLGAGAGEHAEKILRECDDCPELVVIPTGRFQMGSPLSESGRFDSEGPQHWVSIQAFALGKYDVTVAEFAEFVTETGYKPGECDWPRGASWRSPGIVQSDHQPVFCVNWLDAQAYVAWLNDKVRDKAGWPQDREGPYRLPSEAEWEYAARAGTVTARWWGDDIGAANANCNGCGSAWDNRSIAPVGSFRANPFGLYEMLGNVWQWTADCWNESLAGAPEDGKARIGGDCSKRVLRGGSWSNLPRIIRSASRASGGIDDRDYDYASYTSFRVARTIR